MYVLCWNIALLFGPLAELLISNINKLESVQRSFTKRLVGFHHMTYTNRLKLLGLDRLELRRLRADLVTCYKIINGLLDIPFDTVLGWLIIAVHVVAH